MRLPWQLTNFLVLWQTKSCVKFFHRDRIWALSHAIIEVPWIQKLLKELRVEQMQSPILHYDNVSVGLLVKNSTLHSRTKHVEIDFHFIKEKLLVEKIMVQYVPK